MSSDVDAALDDLCFNQARARQSRYTRDQRGQCALPGRHESELLSQLQQGAQAGWWQEYSPDKASSELGDYLSWMFFGFEQQKDDGEWSIRG